MPWISPLPPLCSFLGKQLIRFLSPLISRTFCEGTGWEWCVFIVCCSWWRGRHELQWPHRWFIGSRWLLLLFTNFHFSDSSFCVWCVHRDTLTVSVHKDWCGGTVKCKDGESAVNIEKIHYLAHSLVRIMGLTAVLLAAIVDDRYSFRKLSPKEDGDPTIGNTDCYHSEFCSFGMVWNDRLRDKGPFQ